MKEKQSLSYVESGRVIGVGLVSRSNGRGGLPFTSITPMRRPIFGHSLYAEISLPLIKDLGLSLLRGTTLEKLCKGRQENGHTWHSLSVIPSGPTSLIFMPCRLLPPRWWGSIDLIPFKTLLIMRVSGLGQQKN